MSFAAAFNFIFKPLIDFPSNITASINYAQGICTAGDSHSTNAAEDYLSGSEKSTSGSEDEDEYYGSYQQTKHFAPPLATSPFPSATAKSVDHVCLAKDLESTDPACLTNSDTKPAPGFFQFPYQKTHFALPFVSDLQSKLFTVSGIGAFSGLERSNTAEAQLLRESLLDSAEKPAFSGATSSPVLPYSIKPSYSSYSANAAVPASPRSQLASTFRPKFCRSKLSVPGTRNPRNPSTTSATPVKGPFDNFVHLPPPLPSDPLYTTLPRSLSHQRSAPKATYSPALEVEMAEAISTSSPKPTATTPKNIPWNRVYEIHASQLRGHLRFLKLLAANKGHSQPLTQCISRAETLLKDAATAAAASGISTAGPVPAKPEKRRRSVRFEDEVVAKEAKPDKKNKTAHKSIQRPKMRHAKPSKARVASLLSTLGKRSRVKPSDSDDSSAGGVLDGEKVIRKKMRKEYFTPGMVLEFESSDDEDDGEFVPPGDEEEEDSEDDCDSDESGDAEKEDDTSPSPEVDRKRTKARGVDGKDKDVNRKNVAKEGVEDTTAAKDVPESNKKRKIVVLNAPGQTVPLTQEAGEAGRGKRIRPS
ncbi:unnamed protein product [Tuber melanosporum]|uniref:(Perigord truffle) hypothetical protein n=1 Tax=Tuber melanosporum (strain Mel28) TaxID=656061 RepID=D5GC16_TUBMM|nr:uncharacterized protein GSTUM_00005768001 [Tuber melanosporum]CAZ82059.1 unnamed protein product [Tuber melanosporum]